ncbi:exonuclease SbcCD subunit D [Clostridium sp. AF37-5AT]|nr:MULTISPECIES: exonuclease SbcCD subunit D [unclassified Clostridium]RHO38430.1 exonuclease SbcCD subunit D [Clostridium sp. AM16-23]RHO96141.1 exonuclease SbcCD subunit D [Clostridium sp. AF37-5AT]RHR02159.1 exonuclease SbcCD subunit D [Clostridium sp. AF20-17LB]HCW27270.1 exonuclease sbcCD subunit D [Lachnoclostridium sp.]
MKLFHLSDLHIGKRVNEFSMIEDQKYILKRILDLAEEEKPDGIILAGDIYDKQIPSAEAVQVFDEFITRLAGRAIPVFIISGNHDSAERLAFGGRLLNSRGIYLSPVYDGSVTKIPLKDQYGTVWIHLLPFIRPSTVRHVFENEADLVTDVQTAAETVIRHMEIDLKDRNILVAHQFVTGASRCESEDVQVGGLDNIDAAVFTPFDYTALGHIHSPQNVGTDRVRYCGTPLKYSFSEVDQEKSITVVELEKKGTVRTSLLPLKPLRDMRKLRGTYLELTDRSFYRDMNREDYIQVTLTDEDDVPDGLQKLRVIYPNIMQLLYDNQRTKTTQEVDAAQAVEKKTEMELFYEFYELQNNQPMTKQQKDFAEQLIREIKE